MNLHGSTYRWLPVAAIVIALLISAWLSVPLVLGNSATSSTEPGWPYMPIAFIGGLSLVWLAIWNGSIVLVGSYARRFGWQGRSAVLVLLVPGALVLFFLLTGGWVFVATAVQDWARNNSSELWYSAARNSIRAFDQLVIYSFVSGTFLLAATQLLPNPSLERTSTGKPLGPRAG